MSPKVKAWTASIGVPIVVNVAHQTALRFGFDNGRCTPLSSVSEICANNPVGAEIISLMGFILYSMTAVLVIGLTCCLCYSWWGFWFSVFSEEDEEAQPWQLWPWRSRW